MSLYVDDCLFDKLSRKEIIWMLISFARNVPWFVVPRFVVTSLSKRCFAKMNGKTKTRTINRNLNLPTFFPI